MIKSMTAFARTDRQDEFGELVWELRSVNHRYLDIQARLPEDLRRIEPLVREKVTARLGRGKVECSLRYKPGVGQLPPIAINSAMLGQLLEAMETLKHAYPQLQPARSTDLLAWPGLLLQAPADLEPVQEMALQLLDQALDDLLATRSREGERLLQLLLQRCDLLQELVERARRRMPQIIGGVRERLRARLREVSDSLDVERLEQEMALLAQRLDVDEEMDRLNAHLQEIRTVLQRDEPVGRRLDFLMQELNREANTLGSKSADSETTAISVEMKVVIEQMREQIQNIE